MTGKIETFRLSNEVGFCELAWGMKILFVLPEFPPQYGGGIATYYDSLVSALAAAGHDVKILVGSAFTNSHPTREEDSYTVEFLDVDRRERAIEEFTSYEAVPQLRRTMGAAWALFQQADHGAEYDLIETTDFGLLFLPWVASEKTPPVLVQLHASNGQVDAREPKEGHALQGHLMRMLEVRGLAGADVLQSNGRANARRWSQRLDRDVAYCPPPLSPKPSVVAEEPSRSTTAPGFVAGRVQYWKGPTVLCEAQSHLGGDAPRIDWAGRDTAYRKVGESMSSYLENTYPEVWGRSVRPIGEIPPEEVAQRQRAAQFVVVPSIWDVFNYTAAEAMRAGSVVICSEGAGAADLIEHGTNGFKVPEEEPEALAEVIGRVAALPSANRKKIGEKGRRTVEQELDPERIARRRLRIYENLDSRNNKSDTDRTWLAEAVRPGGKFEVQPERPLAFLDQHAISNIGRYLIRRVRNQLFGPS